MHKVLMVTRAPAIAPELGAALRGAGFDVIEAEPTSACLSALPTADVDVAVVDVGLPGPEGLELCREVRRRCRAPVLAVALSTDAADVVAYLQAGVDDYVMWPIDPAVVAARLRAVLRRGSS